MVSGINSIRVWSSQAALNAFKETTDTSTTSSSLSLGGSSSSSLADILYPGAGSDNDDSEDTKLAALIASLQQQMNGGTTDGANSDDGDAGDMSSKAFMKALRDKLEGLQDNPDTKAMADKMLAALDAGTLTVTDAVNGEQVKAWDVTDSKQLSGAKSEVDKDDWSSYLKGILTREDGKFVRASDGSYVEKATGASGFFGMVGEAYYYLSWTTPAATTETSAKSVASSGGASTD